MMTSKTLEILKRLARPKTREEVEALMIKLHGTTGRENASSDPNALDDVGLKALAEAERKARPSTLEADQED